VIAHTVLCRLNDGAAARIPQLDALVAALPAQIPGLERVLHGESVSTEGLEGGFGWGMVLLFARRADLEGYLPHPDHGPVKALIGELSAEVIVFDVDDQARSA
jgi:hypothetical protein